MQVYNFVKQLQMSQYGTNMFFIRIFRTTDWWGEQKQTLQKVVYHHFLIILAIVITLCSLQTVTGTWKFDGFVFLEVSVLSNETD